MSQQKAWVATVIGTVFIIGLVSGFALMTMKEQNIDPTKPEAVVKPLGFRLENIKTETTKYVITELREVDRTGLQVTWDFRTYNDTKIRQVIVEPDHRPMIGDVVTYEKRITKKTCDIGIQLKLPNGFESIFFKDIDARTFKIDELPDYYRERYSVKIDLETCFENGYKTLNIVTRNDELVQVTVLEEVGLKL